MPLFPFLAETVDSALRATFKILASSTDAGVFALEPISLVN